MGRRGLDRSYRRMLTTQGTPPPKRRQVERGIVSQGIYISSRGSSSSRPIAFEKSSTWCGCWTHSKKHEQICSAVSNSEQHTDEKYVLCVVWCVLCGMWCVVCRALLFCAQRHSTAGAVPLRLLPLLRCCRQV